MGKFPAALPASTVPDPMDAPTLRWGILGPGWIAQRFVQSLQTFSTQQVVAIGSRSLERSTAFAGDLNIATAYGSYEELVADPDIDIVYVATPHNLHHRHALLALHAGKPVLIEKPIALNASQAVEIADLAGERGLFCMEALWTYFLPKFDILRQLLTSEAIGEVLSVQADHGEYFTSDHRIMRADLGGGPLLDLGTYPLSFAQWVLGVPDAVHAVGQLHPAGVNGQVAAVLKSPSGSQSIVHTTIFATTPTTAVITGAEGTITIPGPFYNPGPFTATAADGSAELTFTEPQSSYDGLVFEAAEAARCVSAGRVESAVRPLADSVKTMALIDEIRRQIGVVWDDER